MGDECCDECCDKYRGKTDTIQFIDTAVTKKISEQLRIVSSIRTNGDMVQVGRSSAYSLMTGDVQNFSDDGFHYNNISNLIINILI
jgi:hypothetical protein